RARLPAARRSPALMRSLWLLSCMIAPQFNKPAILPAAGTPAQAHALPQPRAAPYTAAFTHCLEARRGPDPDSWGAHPQPEEHRPDPAARQTDRHHRAIRLGQIVAGVRYAVRRRPTPLCGIVVGLCPAVSVDD